MKGERRELDLRVWHDRRWVVSSADEGDTLVLRHPWRWRVGFDPVGVTFDEMLIGSLACFGVRRGA